MNSSSLHEQASEMTSWALRMLGLGYYRSTKRETDDATTEADR